MPYFPKVGCEKFKMTFGKHKGKTLGDILQDDACYLDWLSEINITDPLLERAVREMCRIYAHEIETALEERQNRYDDEDSAWQSWDRD